MSTDIYSNCPVCKMRKIKTIDFYPLKNGDRDDICKDCIIYLGSIDYGKIFEHYDIPFIESEWEITKKEVLDKYIEDNNDLILQKVFEKYYAKMRLPAFKMFGFNDSEILSKRYSKQSSREEMVAKTEWIEKHLLKQSKEQKDKLEKRLKKMEEYKMKSYAEEQLEHCSKKEMVNHPSHYGGADNPYEAIKVIEAWDADFNIGTTLRYLCRCGKKTIGGSAEEMRLEDLKKARWYLDREISNIEKQIDDDDKIMAYTE